MTTVAVSHSELCPNCKRPHANHRPWCAKYQTIADPPKAGEIVDDPVLGPTCLISAYSRQQAIDDGTLVDCTLDPFDELNRQAGVTFDVAMTRAVFERYVGVPPQFNGAQDINGRYWDIIFMFRRATRQKQDCDELKFEFICIPNGAGCWPNERPMRGSHHHSVQLKVTSHPGDRLEPCLTFMLPSED